MSTHWESVRFVCGFADLAYFAILYGFLYADRHAGPVIELPYSFHCFVDFPMPCCPSMMSLIDNVLSKLQRNPAAIFADYVFSGLLLHGQNQFLVFL